MLYQLPNSFTPFQIEHKERDGALYFRPGTVVELTKADMVAMKKLQPKVARQTFPLPVAKPRHKSVAVPQSVTEEPTVKIEVEAKPETQETSQPLAKIKPVKVPKKKAKK